MLIVQSGNIKFVCSSILYFALFITLLIAIPYLADFALYYSHVFSSVFSTLLMIVGCQGGYKRIQSNGGKGQGRERGRMGKGERRERKGKVTRCHTAHTGTFSHFQPCPYSLSGKSIKSASKSAKLIATLSRDRQRGVIHTVTLQQLSGLSLGRKCINNPLKCSGIRWLHLKLFNFIHV